ncbi:hypothetical protein BDV93DRAFT_515016 [Ceratobasidium sp. AG-I]|nr:hypothetical protein BDV93DRAFT_515016 [Ceratobasidium sp. AG-I]
MVPRIAQPNPVSRIQAVQGSHRLLNRDWDLVAAMAKDTEPLSSSTWNQHLPVDPPADFSKHHTPDTLFIDTRSSFVLSPFDYFDEHFRDIRNAIPLQAKENREYIVDGPGGMESVYAPRALQGSGVT